MTEDRFVDARLCEESRVNERRGDFSINVLLVRLLVNELLLMRKLR